MNRVKYEHLIPHCPLSNLVTTTSGKSQKMSTLMAAFFTKEEMTVLKKTKPRRRKLTEDVYFGISYCVSHTIKGGLCSLLTGKVRQKSSRISSAVFSD